MKSFGLSSRERIKSKKDFEDIYSSGNILISLNNKLRALYVIVDNDQGGVKIAAAIGKKLGNAVWRNRVKRIIRESYRLNKLQLNSACVKKNKLIKVVFSLNYINQRKNPVINLNDLYEDILDLLNKLSNKI